MHRAGVRAGAGGAVARGDVQAAVAAEVEAFADAEAENGRRRQIEGASGTLTFGEIVGEGDEVVSRLGPSM